MKAEKFKLFMGCLENGVTVCNFASMERGDYKTIAHISSGGNIKWYVTEDYVPADDYLKIFAQAAKLRKEFMDWFDKLDDIQKYETMCDSLPYVVLQPVFVRKDVSLQDKIEMLMNDFLKRI